MSNRIIISVTNDLSIDQRVHRMACTLQENGWEVELVGRLLPTSPQLESRPYATKRLRLRVLTGKWFYLLYNVRLFLYLSTRKAHTLLATDMDTLPGNWLAARLRGRRLIYDSHEYWTEVPELLGRPRIRAVWLWLERRLFPRVDKALTVNESIAKVYTQKYGIPVVSVRNLPLRLSAPAPRNEPGRILFYQGALNVGRGIELMIQAMAQLPQEYVLEIAGNGPVRPALEKLVQEMGLEARVHLLGHIPFKLLPQRTSKAALGMSLEEDLGESYHLALPNKLFDYVQSGIPVLVSQLPEMAAVVETHGLGEVLSPDARTPEGLAGKIRSMVEDTAKWSYWRENALHAAETLCWEAEAGKLIGLVGHP